MEARAGDRVRVVTPDSAYTGCRGTVVDDPNGEQEPGGVRLGFYIAIDGENGVARPFLESELELLRARGARPSVRVARRA